MAVNIQYIPVASETAPVPAASDGLFFDLLTLPGLVPTDLEADDADKESKVIRSLLVKFADAFAASAPLGLALTVAPLVNAGINLFNQSYLFSETKIGDLKANTLAPIPVAATGANFGMGEISINQYFPEASLKLAANAAIMSPGILISSASLAAYGGPTHAALSTSADIRSWLTALMMAIIFDSVKRAPNTPSAIVTASKINTVILTPPPSFTAMPNPTTGVLASELPTKVFITNNYSIVIQVRVASSEAPVNNVSA